MAGSFRCPCCQKPLSKGEPDLAADKFGHYLTCPHCLARVNFTVRYDWEERRTAELDQRQMCP